MTSCLQKFLWAPVGMLTILVSGCATTGIVRIAPDTYMVSREDRKGSTNATALKDGVLKDAKEFAERRGKVAVPLSTYETPAAPGGFPTIEYRFKVVEKTDPEAQQVAIQPETATASERSNQSWNDAPIKVDASKGPDLYTELLKLDDLRKKGIITDAEFASEKQKLLNRSR